jgi:cytoskeletal protein RodZ
VITSALRRPLVTTTAAIAVIGASAAGFANTHGKAAPTSFTVSSEAVAQSADLHRASLEDRAYLAKAKNAGSQRAAALAEHTRLAAIARAEKVRKAAAAARAARIERARQAAAAKAARIAQQAAQQAAERRQAADRAARSQARTALAASASADPRSVARAMLGEFGWGEGQFGCLDSLWMKESGWSTSASNGSSGAYGIPQSLPGSKMSSAGPDWQSNPATQIKWGLGYIQQRYGSPCAAWGHSQATNWY